MNRSAKIEKSMMAKDKYQKDFFSKKTLKSDRKKIPFKKYFPQI